MDTGNILISSDDIELAQSICNTIDEPNKRNRAVANVLASNIAASFFKNTEYDIDAETGLHNIGSVLDDIDIADIYVNNHYVDVRLFFNDEELSVPKAHFDNDLLPSVYMFIKLNTDLTKGEIAGFIKPKDIDISSNIDDNYAIKKGSLASFYDIEDVFKNRIIFQDVDDLLIYTYIDKSIENKIEFYKSMLHSKIARLKLAKEYEVHSIFNLISINIPKSPEVSEDKEVSEEVAVADDSQMNVDEDDLMDLLGDDSSQNQYSTTTSPSLNDTIAETAEESTKENSEIDSLFSENNKSNNMTSSKNKSSFSGFLVFIIFLALLGAGGYYGFQYFYGENNSNEITNELEEPNIDKKEKTPIKDAMPIESVEKQQINDNKEEGNALEIPAIEQNLEASILVSNLKVDWEVPSGYVSNTSARRYLIKLGKVIQLNLKTELLLLNKPPISNKITVEIKYNDNIRQFETVGITSSSGEKTVDSVILNTINHALKMNISVNMDSFAKLSGNPILVIHL